MKKLLLTVLLTTSLWGVLAQNTKQEQRNYSVYFAWNKMAITLQSQREELSRVLDEYARHQDAKIDIIGWADKTGSYLVNRNVSLRRAEVVKTYLLRNGIPLDRISVSPGGTDPEAPDNATARRADITVKFFVKQEEPPVEPPKKDTVVAVEPKPIVKPVTIRKDLFSLRSNLLFFLAGVPNIGLELKASNTVGINLNGGWAPWGASSDGKFSWAGWFVSPELRFYLGQQKRWFVGANFITGEYNFKPGETGTQGVFMAGGVTAGYKLLLSKNFDMDFSFGLGFAQWKYDSYRRSDNGINVYTKKGVLKSGFVPTQAGVSLVWKIK